MNKQISETGLLEINAESTLNENQLIVLEYLKKMCPIRLTTSPMVTIYRLVDSNVNDNWQEYYDDKPDHINSLRNLEEKEETQVLKAFIDWWLSENE